jgi:hypothetical protein
MGMDIMSFPRDARAFAARSGAFVAAVFLSAASVAPTPAAFAAGLFTQMGGSWRGDGSVIYTNGQTEGMRCTAKYEVTDDGNKMKQDLTCAFASGGSPLKIKSDITYRAAAGIINGYWSEGSYGLSGTLTGSASSNKIKARVLTTSQNLTVQVEVTTSGGQQTVTLRPTSLDVKEVRVQLRKT